jgi:hypothetical protein
MNAGSLSQEEVHMSYVIRGLNPAPFAPLFRLDDAALAERGIAAMRVYGDGYPCRVSLDGAALGDRVLLLNYQHQPADTPYRSSHAIFVAEHSRTAAEYYDAIAPVMRTRILSIRAFNSAGFMVDADVVDGAESHALIRRLLARADTDYLHVHFAKRGCFAAKVTRS